MNSFLTDNRNIDILEKQVMNKIKELNEISNEEANFIYSIRESIIEIEMPASDTYYGNGKYYDDCKNINDFIEKQLNIVTDGIYWFDAPHYKYAQDPYYYIRIYWDDEDYDDEPYNKEIFI